MPQRTVETEKAARGREAPRSIVRARRAARIPGAAGGSFTAAKRTYELTTEGTRLLDEWAAALRGSRERIDTFIDRYEGR